MLALRGCGSEVVGSRWRLPIDPQAPTDGAESASDLRATLPASIRTLPASQSLRAPRVSEADTLAAAARSGRPRDRTQELSALPPLVLADGPGEVLPGVDLEVLGRLGEGGMGVVERALQRSLGREVAVKRLREGRKSPATVGALLSEARVTGSLEHPNVVPIHALGRDPRGDPVLVMKCVEGVPWSVLIHDDGHARWSDLPSDRLRWHLETLMQVSHAIELAHSRGIVHRDLKPDNVMIGAFGEVYVLDWGIALCPDEVDAAAPVVIAGTPAYMAPEMLKGGPIDARTDVYLLGATLCEVLTRRPRHPGATVEHVFLRILRSEPVVFDAQVPLELGEIVNRATAADPAARFQTARALREAVVAHLAHRDSSALSDEADALFAEIEPELVRAAPAAGLRAKITECRFAYRQALRRWDENERASAGLTRLLCAMFEMEIAEGHRDAAAAILAELGDAADPSLSRALAALDADRTAERARVAALERLAADQNPAQRWRERGRALWVVTGVAALALGGGNAMRWAGLVEVDYPGLIAVGLAPAVMALLVMLRASRRFERVPSGDTNLINRRLGWALTSAVCLAPVLRVLAWTADVPMAQTIAFELACHAVAAVIIGITIHRTFFPMAAVLAAGFALALHWPERVFEIGTVSALSSLAAIAVLWSREGGPDRGSPP